jgi:hypothetical protein
MWDIQELSLQMCKTDAYSIVYVCEIMHKNQGLTTFAFFKCKWDVFMGYT